MSKPAKDPGDKFCKSCGKLIPRKGKGNAVYSKRVFCKPECRLGHGWNKAEVAQRTFEECGAGNETWNELCARTLLLAVLNYKKPAPKVRERKVT